jgi:hypothetical protein
MPSKETKEAAVTAAKAAVEAYGPPTRVILRVIFILLVVIGLLWVISKITGIILLLDRQSRDCNTESRSDWTCLPDPSRGGRGGDLCNPAEFE